ncbi:hypothetical protein OK016_22565 [Vibrio chagasii]|nr:hypothetical protein [Vibrio chagasii]
MMCGRTRSAKLAANQTLLNDFVLDAMRWRFFVSNKTALKLWVPELPDDPVPIHRYQW